MNKCNSLGADRERYLTELTALQSKFQSVDQLRASVTMELESIREKHSQARLTSYF